MKPGFPFRPAALALAAMLLASGCQTPVKPPPRPPAPVGKPARKESYWKDDGTPGTASIFVSLGEQRAYFYKGQKLVGEANISSGKKNFRTPSGDFKVIQKDRNHVSNLYGDFVDEAGEVVKSNVDTSKDPVPEGAVFRGAKMPYFLRFHGGYGMHAGRVPNYPASHGCVRLPRFMAEHFFSNAGAGTPVTIQD